MQRTIVINFNVSVGGFFHFVWNFSYKEKCSILLRAGDVAVGNQMNDKRVSEMAVQKLSVVWEKRYLCPRCQQKLRYVPGDAVAIVDGRVDMTRTQPYYVCDKCHTSYRELMGSGYFEEYEGVDARLPAADAPADAGQAAAPEQHPAKPKHPLRST